MNIMHLCSYYIGNKLYNKLFREFSKNRITQQIYIPIKDSSLVGKNMFEAENVHFIYDPILQKYDRYFYGNKIKKQKGRIEHLIKNINSYEVIHAHTLFSDGGTAYLLKKKYGIKYVVSIRNTDINTFYKYAIHYRSFSHKVLLNAEAIIFISHAYRKKFFNIFPSSLIDEIKHKIHVIPNGIDSKWLISQKNNKKEDIKKQLRLLFTGTLDSNKNLSKVIDLIQKLKSNNMNVLLNVAGDGPLKEELINKVAKLGLQNNIKFFGQIEINKLIELADHSHIFILPSYKETFGISYIEAMSRGLPIIYTRGEGIDGFFPEGSVGYATNPDDILEMENNLKLIIDNYEEISKKCKEFSQNFNWKDIANLYINLYKKI